MLGHSGLSTGIESLRFGGEKRGEGYLDLVLGDVFGGAGGEEKVVVFCWLEELRELSELKVVL